MQKPDIQELSNFLIKYISTMVGVGTYSSRVNRCAERIAATFGYEIHLHFSFNHTLINLIDPDDISISRTYLVNNKYSPIDFRLILDLSALSWAIYDHIHNLKVAKRCFEKLIQKNQRPAYTYILFASIAQMAFSRLFGGDFETSILVFLGTLVGSSLRAVFTHFKLDMRIQYIICAFISSYIVSIGVDLGFTKTGEVALGSSILYLIPGIFFINSVIDILKSYVLVGLSRIISVAILISCIAVGIYTTLALSNLGFWQ
ncbi:hypothetical protein DMB95_01795 [Campylobacter sp. MIT 12-8780]|uniref:threonine/serine ThrE exporter family protein n=1 Tax=unclassified Campylobacter TaxID=2593542 RepID=UPI00115CBC11|nr:MULTISPECIES: threonine/serine exporter family protein [unclassified Campylobacter]NDJ26808.1 threonine/serine exporter family protein [Campylobacter sp. MIT 19-121]TQR42371.1 hypothetical protein DMB95_01795 [Campylobacter sp. MIT 12-8780]